MIVHQTEVRSQSGISHRGWLRRPRSKHTFRQQIAFIAYHRWTRKEQWSASFRLISSSAGVEKVHCLWKQHEPKWFCVPASRLGTESQRSSSQVDDEDSTISFRFFVFDGGLVFRFGFDFRAGSLSLNYFIGRIRNKRSSFAIFPWCSFF